ncbi:hypothetical protein BDA96_03G319900 [Sorghum bicolor]|uniref:Uncharacterized protein n=2 Tax=Sorghum bicolor TaxID=4558 RepID=A0A921RGG3_SORBI|nr:hypothetical protein BDA96_03G319900 [Sorghum bicolor]OQU87545.1 hypothetical protein SORBI_3003G296250 [Sorghum bicolor]
MRALRIQPPSPSAGRVLSRPIADHGRLVVFLSFFATRAELAGRISSRCREGRIAGRALPARLRRPLRPAGGRWMRRIRPASVAVRRVGYGHDAVPSAEHGVTRGNLRADRTNTLRSKARFQRPRGLVDPGCGKGGPVALSSCVLCVAEKSRTGGRKLWVIRSIG